MSQSCSPRVGLVWKSWQPGPRAVSLDHGRSKVGGLQLPPMLAGEVQELKSTHLRAAKVERHCSRGAEVENSPSALQERNCSRWQIIT